MLEQFTMFVHNVISHPLMGILQLLGFDDAAIVVHDMTAPSNGIEFPLLGDVIKIVQLDDESVRAGHNFTEFVTLSKGEFSINQLPATATPNPKDDFWIVSYKVNGEWRQSRSSDLNEAIEAAIEACLVALDSKQG